MTRVSLGVQAFDDDSLILAGRAHTKNDVLKAIRIIKESAFRENYNIDLISGLPHTSVAQWANTLDGKHIVYSFLCKALLLVVWCIQLQ